MQTKHMSWPSTARRMPPHVRKATTMRHPGTRSSPPPAKPGSPHKQPHSNTDTSSPAVTPASPAATPVPSRTSSAAHAPSPASSVAHVLSSTAGPSKDIASTFAQHTSTPAPAGDKKSKTEQWRLLTIGLKALGRAGSTASSGSGPPAAGPAQATKRVQPSNTRCKCAVEPKPTSIDHKQRMPGISYAQALACGL